jgi:hypothetical protein
VRAGGGGRLLLLSTPRGLHENQSGSIAPRGGAWPITADRPYLKALSEECARVELKAGQGTQFDGGLVDALLGILEGEA